MPAAERGSGHALSSFVPRRLFRINKSTRRVHRVSHGVSYLQSGKGRPTRRAGRPRCNQTSAAAAGPSRRKRGEAKGLQETPRELWRDAGILGQAVSHGRGAAAGRMRRGSYPRAGFVRERAWQTGGTGNRSRQNSCGRADVGGMARAGASPVQAAVPRQSGRPATAKLWRADLPNRLPAKTTRQARRAKCRRTIRTSPPSAARATRPAWGAILCVAFATAARPPHIDPTNRLTTLLNVNPP